MECHNILPFVLHVWILSFVKWSSCILEERLLEVGLDFSLNIKDYLGLGICLHTSLHRLEVKDTFGILPTNFLRCGVGNYMNLGSFLLAEPVVACFGRVVDDEHIELVLFSNQHRLNLHILNLVSLLVDDKPRELHHGRRELYLRQHALLWQDVD